MLTSLIFHIIGGNYYTGGIAGYINSVELLGCYSTADVSASGAGGGIAGENHGGSNMQYNFYSGTVSASKHSLR